MDDEQLWSIYFAGVASIRMHPRNDYNALIHREALKDTIRFAATVADEMLNEHHKRFPVETGET